MKKLLAALLMAGVLVLSGCGGLNSALTEDEAYEDIEEDVVEEEIEEDAGATYDEDADAAYDDDADADTNEDANADADTTYDEDEADEDEDADHDYSDDAEIMRFTAEDLDGNEVLLGDLISDNKVTMINYWGTFCGPCINEMPDLADLERQYKDDGFEIIGLTCDIVYPGGYLDEDALKDAKEIVAELNVDYPVIVATDEINEYVGAEYIPVTFFVDAHGEQIGDEIVGSRSRNEWEETIRDLLH